MVRRGVSPHMPTAQEVSEWSTHMGSVLRVYEGKLRPSQKPERDAVKVRREDAVGTAVVSAVIT
jgi:hypothetical protein